MILYGNDGQPEAVITGYDPDGFPILAGYDASEECREHTHHDGQTDSEWPWTEDDYKTAPRTTRIETQRARSHATRRDAKARKLAAAAPDLDTDGSIIPY
jgi:hypothetical protein